MFADLPGVKLSYEDTGSGEPVVLVMGAGATGRVWHTSRVLRGDGPSEEGDARLGRHAARRSRRPSIGRCATSPPHKLNGDAAISDWLDLSREVADVIPPGARYVELERCGHYGYLERPDVVNAAVLDFFVAGHR